LIGESARPETLQAAVLGSDLVLGSLPAEPVQVVNACFALGYDIVVPASWGDELIAGSVLDELSARPPGTTILCSCPNARKRLLAGGNELSPFVIQSVAPPVATARYLRALHGTSSLRVTFIGSCCGADDESIAERLSPPQFLEMCAKRGISLSDQPRVFEAYIPTDRRRHVSLPGGLPTPESVRAIRATVDVLSLDATGLAFDLTQCIISGRHALLDVAPAVGCPCSGFVGESAWNDGRETLAALEPPRSPTPVIDSRIIVDLELPGQSQPVPSYEESVPLSVVVGADLTDADGGFANDPTPPRKVAEQQEESVVTASPEPLQNQAHLSELANEFELSWSEAAVGFDVVTENSTRARKETPASSSAGDVQSRNEASASVVEAPETAKSAVITPQISPRRGGTPTGTPALRTPAGPLPRAYLMQRRLVTGEQPVVPASVDSAPVAEKPVEVNDSEEAGAAAAAPVSGNRQNRGTVDTVLDILSKAIRDVVEP
jgi:hypothetical protein